MSTPTDPTPRPPLTLTVDPRLDAAVQAGWEAWETAARTAGAERVAAWLANRVGEREFRREALPTVAAFLDAAGPEARAEAVLELAELVEAADDLVVDTLWEGVLAAGRESGDADTIFEATGRLAAIAEGYGDPLAAAEYRLDFLNWRRQDGHFGDPEQVEAAFEEVVRLAEADGARKEAALFDFRLARYARLADAEDERAVTGDWEDDPAPYAGWT